MRMVKLFASTAGAVGPAPPISPSPHALPVSSAAIVARVDWAMNWRRLGPTTRNSASPPCARIGQESSHMRAPSLLQPHHGGAPARLVGVLEIDLRQVHHDLGPLPANGVAVHAACRPPR